VNHKIFILVTVAFISMFLVTMTVTAHSETVTSLMNLFLPVILKNYQLAPPTSPAGVLYIFSTTATTSGAGGGRSGMNAKCRNADNSAHFCTIHEIENAMKTTGAFFNDPFQKAWVDNISNSWTYLGNCGGWQSPGNDATGFSIELNAVGTSFESCNITISISCCKWIP